MKTTGGKDEINIQNLILLLHYYRLHSVRDHSLRHI
jgi:hypothetical protein